MFGSTVFVWVCLLPVLPSLLYAWWLGLYFYTWAGFGSLKQLFVVAFAVFMGTLCSWVLAVAAAPFGLCHRQPCIPVGKVVFSYQALVLQAPLVCELLQPM